SVITGKSRFFAKKYARTAVGLLPNGNLLFIIVEAKQRNNDGFTLLELANYFLTKNCESALNLDGGGSSTLVIKNRLINKPSGREWGLGSLNKTAIPVANAFLIYEKNL